MSHDLPPGSPDPLHGSVGTPAVCATMELAILSPRAHMACAGGPRKVMLCLWSSSGSLGFSEAWPHPAHTAWGGGGVSLNYTYMTLYVKNYE